MRRVHPPAPPWIADLHIHSKFSRACSRDLELDNLAWWAQRKGITLLGTADFTHPGWYDHLPEHLLPAHIWTPWSAALGSRSGVDAIAGCYADLAGHIRAVETGLSSDPEMNWRVSSLDGYQLVSNSDAHSPQALAREATALTAELSYH